jgi:hypothetical protein
MIAWEAIGEASTKIQPRAILSAPALITNSQPTQGQLQDTTIQNSC